MCDEEIHVICKEAIIAIGTMLVCVVCVCVVCVCVRVHVCAHGCEAKIKRQRLLEEQELMRQEEMGLLEDMPCTIAGLAVSFPTPQLKIRAGSISAIILKMRTHLWYVLCNIYMYVCNISMTSFCYSQPIFLQKLRSNV